MKPLGPVPVKGLADAGRGLRADGGGAGADPPAGGRPARAHALRRPRRRAGAAPPRPAARRRRPRSGGGDRRRGRGGQVAPGLRVHPLASPAGLARPRERLRLLRQGHELPARDRSAQGLFRIQDRDDLREIREKVTGKLLTLDRALEPTLPALLALLDVPVDDRRLAGARPAPAPPAHARRREAAAAARSQEQPLLVGLRGPALDRRRDPGAARQPGREPGLGAPAAARELPSRVPARLGQQDVLQPAAARRAPGRERRRAAGGAPRRRPGLAPLKQLLVRAREPVLPRGDRPDAGGDEGAGGRARTLPADAAGRGDPGPGHGPGDPGGAHRPARPGGQAPPAGGRGHRQGRAVRAAPGDRRRCPDEALRRGLAHLQAAEFLYETGLFPDLEYTSSTRSRTRSRTAACCRSAAASSTRASSTRSRRSTGSPRRAASSGSPITPSGRGVGEGGALSPAGRAARRPRGRRSRTPGPGSSRRSVSSRRCRRASPRWSRPSRFASSCGRCWSSSVKSGGRWSACARPRPSPSD